MLDILRKKASSLITKVLLGLIAVVFIFFFGSQSLRGPTQGDRTLAEVNGYPIKEGTVNGLLRLQKEVNPIYRNLPESFEPQLRQGILFNLIDSRVALEAAQKIGLRVTDEEIADVIRKDQSLWKDGAFDFRYYHEQFRPGYQSRYGIDYENQMKRELLLNKLRNLFAQATFIADQEVKDYDLINQTRIKLKRIEIDPKKLAREYTPPKEEVDKIFAEQSTQSNKVLDQAKSPEEDDAEDPLRQQIERDLKEKGGLAQAEQLSGELWPLFTKNQLSEQKLKEYNLSDREIPFVSLTNPESLFPGAEKNLEIVLELFSLTKKNPFPKHPIKIGNQSYFFKLIDKEKPEAEKTADVSEQNKKEMTEQLITRFYNNWLQKKKEQAKISVTPL